MGTGRKTGVRQLHPPFYWHCRYPKSRRIIVRRTLTHKLMIALSFLTLRAIFADVAPKPHLLDVGQDPFEFVQAVVAHHELALSRCGVLKQHLGA
jgi:hypothetical protein